MNVINELIRYVQEILGVPVSVESWLESRNLPQYMREEYEYSVIKFRVELFSSEYLLLLDMREREQPASRLGKHIERVQQLFDGDVVYVRRSVTSYNRKRLIKHRIPFIVPGNQLYLPMLGLDLREYMRQQKMKPESFSPATQVLLLCALLHQCDGVMRPLEMAEKLGYSSMTMTRAFDQLVMAEIAEHSKEGKERHLRLSFNKRALWEEAQLYLTSPLKKRFFADPSKLPSGCLFAGESALSHYSMLAEPREPVIAIASGRWKAIERKLESEQGHLLDLGMFEVEIWKYPPEKLSRGKMVDRLSLYLSLRDKDDERIQDALEDLLEGMQW